MLGYMVEVDTLSLHIYRDKGSLSSVEFKKRLRRPDEFMCQRPQLCCLFKASPHVGPTATLFPPYARQKRALNGGSSMSPVDFKK